MKFSYKQFKLGFLKEIIFFTGKKKNVVFLNFTSSLFDVDFLIALTLKHLQVFLKYFISH